jgi:hypothetical protein
MAHLLLKETFDAFSFIEGEITTFNTFSIDGYLQKEFFDEAPERNYSYWKEVREFCWNIIRGKRTPLHFKIVLSLDAAAFAQFLNERQITVCTPEEIQGLYLNFRYHENVLQCVTGISMKSFTMDKTLEHEWDAYVTEFFKTHGIEAESV